MYSKSRIFPKFMTPLLAILLCFIICRGCADQSFEIKRIGNIHPYAENAFRINTPEAGSLKISIHDNICVYRTISETVPKGESKIVWDGCGYNGEKLYEKTYTITAELTSESGNIYSVSFDSPVEYAAQCLQYALISSDSVYLDNYKSWFVEYRTVTNGTVIIELWSKDQTKLLYSYPIKAKGGKITRMDLSEIVQKKEIPGEGEYTLIIYEISKPDNQFIYSLHVFSSSPGPDPIEITGEIIPDRNMSDDEIWEMMMKPSVVIDIDSFKHQDVYSAPDINSPSLGTLHGQSQGLKVIAIEENWALIGAWNHEDASYIEGWIPISKLKKEAPRGEYGILIDKQKQTMTIYQNGKPIDTLLVSTGRAEKNSLYQETSAGAFLTGYHRVNFSMNGKKYDYVIQYDGGNLLHQTPYEWGQHKKDFTLGRAYLGAKASHACVRIQPEPGKGGLNAYWLFTHIPYHTRIMILDDPWEREATSAKLKREKNDDVDISSLNVINSFFNTSDKEVIITFGGSFIPGGNRTFNSRSDSFISTIQNKGYDFPLSKLKEIFSHDDLTCIELRGIILNEQEAKQGDKKNIYGPYGTEKILESASVELISMPNDRVISSGNELVDKTGEYISQYTDVLNSGLFYTRMLKGHLFGFAGLTENDYVKDPEIIDRTINNLIDSGCEKKVVLIGWSDKHEPAHSIVQEAMVHRCVRAGADLIVGNCAGIVQGIDLIEGVPVIYSTGDLLIGNTSDKPKNQQGIIAQAAFCFDTSNGDTKVNIMPLLPYGSTETKQNEYCPSADMSSEQFKKIIKNIWQDTTDAAMNLICFFFSDDQS